MGWIFVFFMFFLLNFYVWWHYRKVRKWYIKGMEFIHFLLFFVCVIYLCCFFLHQTTLFFMPLFSYLSGFYLCFTLYSGIGFMVTDFYDIVIKKLFQRENKNLLFRSTFFLLFAIVLTIYGMFHAQTLTITYQDVILDKKDSKLTSLKAVAIGDMHVGVMIHEKNLESFFETLQKQSPDVVFLLGDIFDEGSSSNLKKKVISLFGSLKTTYGVYYIKGNHELRDPSLSAELEQMKEAHIHVLEDEVFCEEDLFCVIGRLDVKERRKSLDVLLDRMSESLPVILLDHRPYKEEAIQSGKVDLQLSAHTHNGQIFPFHPFDHLFFYHAYGMYQKDHYQLFVTSGAGVWGIPVRVGSNREMVVLNLHFQSV